MIRRLLAALVACLVPSLAMGQGLLIDIRPAHVVHLPRPTTITITRPEVQPSSYKIKELLIESTLKDQLARTQVSQSFVNTGSTQMEVCFVFPLPYDGAIEQLTLLVDGKEHPAKLLDAAEARKLYESIVRKNQDPALLEWIGTGMFKTSVFPVPPGAERKVTLKYAQLCRKSQGLTDFVFPLSTAKYTSRPVEKLELRLSIESSSDIKNVYSPSHNVEVKRPDNRHATVTFKASDTVPSCDFRLLYDAGKGQVSASVVSYRPNRNEDGYYLLLASPEVKQPDQEQPKKTVMFVVDRSGSMSGEKFEQARGALRFVLNNLREGDMFNVIAYDSQVESFRPELQRYDSESRTKALAFVDGLYSGGSTNISGALSRALEQLKDSSRPNYVIFLTDGLPTEGETNESKIVSMAESSNSVRARIFAFGVGYDVNSRLLDKLARNNFGQTEYVRPNENIESRVSSFYSRISAPVLADININLRLEGSQGDQPALTNRSYPSGTQDLFAGEQLVSVGRYRQGGRGQLVISGKIGSQKSTFEFPVELVEHSSDSSAGYIEKLWAIRRIGEIIDQIDLKGRNEELIKECVQLSTKHGVMTPYTSFLADEATDRHDVASNSVRLGQNVRSLEAASGASGFRQRVVKQNLQREKLAESSERQYFADSDSYDVTGNSSGPVAAPAAAFGRGESGRVAGLSLSGAARHPGTAGKGGADAKGAKFEELVRNVGQKTFYRRGGQWIDAALSKEQEAKPIKIARFSREYFELIDRHSDAAKYLTMDEPAVVEIAGQAYSY